MTAVASSEDPHSLLSRLSLADSTSPSGANSPVPTTPEANVAHLARIQARRVAKIARAETALWKPITLAEAGREVDPEQALKGKEVRLTPDGRARIVKRAGRNVYLTDGTAWQVQLDGFHHKTDEEEYEDPLTAASPYALQTSSLWDALFDARPSIADGDERAVVIREATYGLRTENGESTVGLGIKWARKPAKEGGKDEGGWAWIWGELDGFDDDDEDDEMEEGDEDAEGKDGAADKAVSVEKEAPEERKRFKGVHLAQLVEDDDDNNEAEADKAGDEAAADA